MKIKILFTSLAILAGSLGWFLISPKGDNGREPVSEFCDNPLTIPLNYDAVKAFITDRRIRSTQGLLDCLPKAFRAKYVMMFKSNSLQFASYKFPRIIMWDPKGAFVLAHSGDPSQFGYNNLEMMEFDRETARFKFHEVSFAENSGPRFDDNPVSCRDCHKPDLRPNWEVYNIWRGAYFGHDFHTKADSPEGRGYEDFIANGMGQGTYRHLVPHKVHFDGSTHSDFSERLREIGIYFAGWNRIRLLRIMKESPGFQEMRFATLGILLGCDPKSLIPDQISRMFPRSPADFYSETRSFAQWENDRRRKSRHDHGLPDDGHSVIELAYHEDPRAQGKIYGLAVQFRAIVGLRWLYENRGIPTHDWHMNFDSNFYSFADGTPRAMHYMLPDLVEAVGDAEVSALFTGLKERPPSAFAGAMFLAYEDFKTNSELKSRCDVIAKKSHDALNAVKDVKQLFVAESKPGLLSAIESCRRCHGPAGGSRTAFTLMEPRVGSELSKSGFINGTLRDEILDRIDASAPDSHRMPYLSIPLSVNQTRELKKYLRAIK